MKCTINYGALKNKFFFSFYFFFLFFFWFLSLSLLVVFDPSEPKKKTKILLKERQAKHCIVFVERIFIYTYTYESSDQQQQKQHSVCLLSTYITFLLALGAHTKCFLFSVQCFQRLGNETRKNIVHV